MYVLDTQKSYINIFHNSIYLFFIIKKKVYKQKPIKIINRKSLEHI
ncbi:hypothetical protein CCYN2B_40157 [Capnocytophaga cynodegmi]|uniref:Uncharacterized protein n=1 Tax=Capnocytophaga cynodegmi TaxID=28189 RepID=A0A0B7HI84_9FLAO|nr:hypothetical protein CCYN2B_40157 [Capnocytophaga cynodegmi]